MTSIATTSIADLMEAAATAAHLGGRRSLAYYQTPVVVETKPDDSPVTQADREAEAVMREFLRARFPGHAILGEEAGEELGNPGAGDGGDTAAVRWIIDPIDGTKSFIRGVPLYATLIGVEVAGEVVAGALALPALGELVVAGRGLGCFCNGRRVRVNDQRDLGQATLLVTDERHARERSGAFAALGARVKLVRSWGDAYGYYLVATGRAELMLDPAMNPWDCAPLLPILSEAGGRFSDWQGQATIYGGDALGSNGWLHEAALAVLQAEG
jgi:histidinol-phosphatase